MARDRKYKRCEWVPFRVPQPEYVYQQVRRADDKLSKARDLGVLDESKLKKMVRDFGKLLLCVGFAAYYLGLNVGVLTYF